VESTEIVAVGRLDTALVTKVPNDAVVETSREVAEDSATVVRYVVATGRYEKATALALPSACANVTVVFDVKAVTPVRKGCTAELAPAPVMIIVWPVLALSAEVV